MATKQVLVIDDEEVIQIVIQECLQELAGWHVLTASSGKDGIEIARSQTPDAILLDISMPQMDGVTTYQRLQEDPISKTIPVILLTAKAQSDDQAQFAELAIAGIIFKPFDALTLTDQIAKLLNWDS
jgi:CheY-like chemotaxis protein